MKNLTKGIFIVLIALFGYQMNAQSFGVKGGLNMASIVFSGDEASDKFNDLVKSIMGFHVGLTAEFPVNDMVAFETGLFYSAKGATIEAEEGGSGFSSDVNLNYLDIPLTLKAYYDLGGMKGFGFAGAYIGYGLSGKFTTTLSVGGNKETEEDDVEWGSEKDDDFKKLDYGITIGGGFDFNNISIGLAYDMGLVNIDAYQEEGESELKNKVIKISVGYKF